ncbi:MAG: hypothetical protein GKR90_25655 [Pseudomonadales bacterium]|nr:hypothetical protein [Pseudomonadales bacterium]
MRPIPAVGVVQILALSDSVFSCVLVRTLSRARLNYFTPEEERNLIRQAQSGFQGAAQELVACGLPFVRKKLKRCFPVLSESDLDDLGQELFLKLLGVVSKYDLNRNGHTRFYNFAHYTIFAAATDWVSRTRREVSLDGLTLTEELAHDECPFEQRDVDDQARTALASVSGREREVLLRRFYVDETVKLRTDWSCSAQNVYYVQSMALAKARDALSAHYSIYG